MWEDDNAPVASRPIRLTWLRCPQQGRREEVGKGEGNSACTRVEPNRVTIRIDIPRSLLAHHQFLVFFLVSFFFFFFLIRLFSIEESDRERKKKGEKSSPYRASCPSRSIRETRVRSHRQKPRALALFTTYHAYRTE